MPDGDLDRWARFMTAMLRPGGSAVVIHKAEALPEFSGPCPAASGIFCSCPSIRATDRLPRV